MNMERGAEKKNMLPEIEYTQSLFQYTQDSVNR